MKLTFLAFSAFVAFGDWDVLDLHQDLVFVRWHVSIVVVLAWGASTHRVWNFIQICKDLGSIYRKVLVGVLGGNSRLSQLFHAKGSWLHLDPGALFLQLSVKERFALVESCRLREDADTVLQRLLQDKELAVPRATGRAGANNWVFDYTLPHWLSFVRRGSKVVETFVKLVINFFLLKVVRVAHYRRYRSLANLFAVVFLHVLVIFYVCLGRRIASFLQLFGAHVQ